MKFDGTEVTVTVEVSDGKKSRTYVFNVTGDQSIPALKDLVVSTSNSYADDAAYLSLDPVFTQERYEYTLPCIMEKINF